MEYKLVETQIELDAYIDDIKKCEYIAIDTEFVRRTTYYPKLSLIQICFKPQFAIVIDCLSIANLDGLLDVIYNPNIVKVFHAARQDLEIFYNKRQALPKNIFDTQLAAILIDFAKDMSYEKIVKTILDIDIDKSLTNSDWLHRPLLPTQIQYAANDVLYLFEIYPIILKLLEKHHNLNWREDLFAPLGDSYTYENRIDKDIMKLSRDFSDSSLALIHNLLTWRENLAQSLDIPRNRILAMETIKEIAKNPPTNIKSLRRIVSNKLNFKQLKQVFSILSKKGEVE